MWLLTAVLAGGASVLVARAAILSLAPHVGASLAVFLSLPLAAALGVGVWRLARWVAVKRLKLQKLIDMEVVGLWRLHRLLMTLLWIAVASFVYHAVHWVWVTEVPRVRSDQAQNAVAPPP
jgi:hypothetical protein